LAPLTERSTNSDSEAPRGREEVKAALLSAAANLCSARLPSSVSIRDIASEAQVNPSLVYFYFDSKDDLLRAALDELAEDIAAEAERQPDAAETLRSVMGRMSHDSAFPRIVTGLALDGRNVTEEMSGHPFLQLLASRIAEEYPGEDVETRVGVALVATLSIGVHLPIVNTILGRSATDDELLTAICDTVLGAIDNSSGESET
jgi:AcrR family transcriptional regulator